MNTSSQRAVGKRLGASALTFIPAIIGVLVCLKPTSEQVIPFLSAACGALCGAVISQGRGTKCILLSGLGGAIATFVWLFYLIPIPPMNDRWMPLILITSLGGIAGILVGTVSRWCMEGVAMSTSTAAQTPPLLNPGNTQLRWYQLSLQRLLLLFALCGVFLGTIGYRSLQLREQTLTIHELQELGCAVGYRGSWVNNLHLLGPKFRDSHLASLKSLPHIEYLNLEGSRVTNSGLKKLGSLKELRALRLKGMSISDAGLENLEPLSSLQELNLENTVVTQTGIKQLEERLPNCKINW